MYSQKQRNRAGDRHLVWQFTGATFSENNVIIKIRRQRGVGGSSTSITLFRFQTTTPLQLPSRKGGDEPITLSSAAQTSRYPPQTPRSDENRNWRRGTGPRLRRPILDPAPLPPKKMAIPGKKTETMTTRIREFPSPRLEIGSKRSFTSRVDRREERATLELELEETKKTKSSARE